MNKLKALWAKTPAGVKSESWHVFLVFAITFAVTAAPAIPALVSTIELGQLPDFTALQALVVASAVAGVKALIPVLRALAVTVFAKVVKKAQDRKDFKAAVTAFMLASAAKAVPVPGSTHDATVAAAFAAASDPNAPNPKQP